MGKFIDLSKVSIEEFRNVLSKLRKLENHVIAIRVKQESWAKYTNEKNTKW